MDAHLHQDWPEEYASDIEAFDDFRSRATDADRENAELLAELDGALAMPEDELFALIEPMSYYDFDYFGENAHAWLGKLRAHLVSQMGPDHDA